MAWVVGLALAAIAGWTLLRWRSYHLGSLLVRTSRQTAEWIWHDVWVGVVVAVLVITPFAIFLSNEWKRAVAFNIAAYLVVLAAIWLASFVRTAFWRSINGSWRTTVYQHIAQPNIATIVLYGRDHTTHIVQGLRCHITDPNGVRSTWTRNLAGQVWDLTRIYPDEFQGAAQLVNGRYRVLWELRRDGRCRELLLKDLNVRVPATQTSPPWQ